MKLIRILIVPILCMSLSSFAAPDFDDINGCIDHYSPKIVKLAVYCGLIYGSYHLCLYAKKELKKHGLL